ncbi:MAG: methionine--tRNA ligase, partial [Pseudomonadota bacterium]|nr:methionine--tRNA ligase [Pseudomonadota bacterium]
AGQVRFALNLIPLYAVLSAPFIPDAADKLHEAMKVDAQWPGSAADAVKRLPAGHAFAVPDNLFGKISDEQREEWQGRFAGTRS